MAEGADTARHGIRVVSATDLRAFEEAVLGALGVPADQAAVVADNLVEADLRGVESHGAHLMELYVARLRSGHLRPVTEVSVVRDDGSTVLLDGGLGFGQVAGVAAMDLALERVAEHGTVAVSVRESTHLGALAYYTQRAAEAGCFAMAFQNGPTIVPPFGGRSGIFSTNPFSYAVPAGEEPPIVYDIATTAVAGNKILLAKKRGDATIPEGWACDEHGRPTTDTRAASTTNLQWFGGYKGFGIAMLVELLAGVLADSCYGTTENTRSELHGAQRIAKGYLFLVLDVGRFLPRDDFGRRVDTLIRDVRAADRAEGVEQIFVPGEIEHRRRAERVASGIPLSDALVEELSGIGEELGVGRLG